MADAEWIAGLEAETADEIDMGQEADMTKDPVCGMEVDETKAAATAEYQGRTYFFCSSACHQAFTRQPEKYTQSGTPAPQHGGGPRR